MNTLPHNISDALLALEKKLGLPLYVVGGSVRDLLLQRQAADIDCTLGGNAYNCAEVLREILGGGAVISLSEEEGEEAVRFIWQGVQLDFASFRCGVVSLEEDLRLRDFTINAMALPLADYLRQDITGLIDPCGGKDDLLNRRLRHLPGAFVSDPLRMLRGYRFAARESFSLAEESRKRIRALAQAICRPAAERRSYELRQIFLSNRTAATVSMMAEDGLLAYLLPELYLGEGVTQPEEFHHLSVLDHCFLALEMMEKIILTPEEFFQNENVRQMVTEYLADEEHIYCLKWAALLHDIGKAVTRKYNEEKERVTFYGHDTEGRRLFETFAHRSRWSRENTLRVGRMIEMHMHPFHLVNQRQKGELSNKAALRFSRKSGDEFCALFLMAFADCLAGNPKHHAAMQEELHTLFISMENIYRTCLLPVHKGRPLLNGKDLIALGLPPGPLFSTVLTSLEEAQVEGEVADRQAALAWVQKFFGEYLSNNNKMATTCVK